MKGKIAPVHDMTLYVTAEAQLHSFVTAVVHGVSG